MHSALALRQSKLYGINNIKVYYNWDRCRWLTAIKHTIKRISLNTMLHGYRKFDKIDKFRNYVLHIISHSDSKLYINYINYYSY